MICEIVLFIIIFITLFLLICEYTRLTCTLQHFQNVDTKKASFSLTTIPSRLPHIERNIKSLLAQNPKTVYLNIPYIFNKTKEPYEIPKWLDKYTKNKQVTLIRPEDKGPATKFLGLFETDIDPEHYIIVVDDDQIYNQRLLSNLVKKADDVKGECVVCSEPGMTIYKPGVLDYAPTGFSGYIFKRKLLDKITYFVWPKECFLVDDIWIAKYFHQRGIKTLSLFNIPVANFSTSKTPSNLGDFFNLLFRSYAGTKGSYRAKVQEINPLYANRGAQNEICMNTLNNLLG